MFPEAIFVFIIVASSNLFAFILFKSKSSFLILEYYLIPKFDVFKTVSGVDIIEINSFAIHTNLVPS